MASFCPNCEADMVICQRCGRDVCSVKHSTQWVEGVGNVCDVCAFPELQFVPITAVIREYCNKNDIVVVRCKDMANALKKFMSRGTKEDYQEHESRGGGNEQKGNQSPKTDS